MRDDRIDSIHDGSELPRLPVFAPDPALWSRVVAAHQRRTRVQRWQRGGGALAAAAAVCAAVLWLPHPQPSPQQEVAAGQQESQQLEHEWQQLTDAGRADGSGLTRVRLIDAVLQAAYEHGAAADELAPLWQQRNQALRSLIMQLQATNTTDAPAVTRI